MKDFIDFEQWYVEHYCLDCAKNGKKPLNVDMAKLLYKASCNIGEIPLKDDKQETSSKDNKHNTDMNLPEFVAYETQKALQEGREVPPIALLESVYIGHLKSGTRPKRDDWGKISADQSQQNAVPKNSNPNKTNWKNSTEYKYNRDESPRQQRLDNFAKNGDSSILQTTDFTDKNGKIDIAYALEVASLALNKNNENKKKS